MRYHLFLKFFGKVVKVKQTSSLLRKCLVSIAHHCKLNKFGLFFDLFVIEIGWFLTVLELELPQLMNCILSLEYESNHLQFTSEKNFFTRSQGNERGFYTIVSLIFDFAHFSEK